jgi:Domain of unknown function (DUF397)
MTPNVWVKSSFSQIDACVEVKQVSATGNIMIRDSKYPNGSVLEFTPLEWAAFKLGVQHGEFDNP